MLEDQMTRSHQVAGRRVRVSAPAKLNLHLEVLRRRPDGYHDIETVMQAVDLSDRIQVTLLEARRSGKPEIEVLVRPENSAPETEENLCWQAAALFCQRLGVSGVIHIEIDKEIPSGAGLGGGSSDAMATLVACNKLFDSDLSLDRLAEMGAALGSDVPFFARGGTQLARGRGTDLTVLPHLNRVTFALLKPRFDVATAGAYEALRMGLTVRPPAANLGVIKPLLATFPGRPWFGYNRFEDVVLPQYPELSRLLLELRDQCPVAMMTGSGSAVFGVFRSSEQGDALIREYESKLDFARTVEPLSHGVVLIEG